MQRSTFWKILILVVLFFIISFILNNLFPRG